MCETSEAFRQLSLGERLLETAYVANVFEALEAGEIFGMTDSEETDHTPFPMHYQLKLYPKLFKGIVQNDFDEHVADISILEEYFELSSERLYQTMHAKLSALGILKEQDSLVLINMGRADMPRFR